MSGTLIIYLITENNEPCIIQHGDHNIYDRFDANKFARCIFGQMNLSL